MAFDITSTLNTILSFMQKSGYFSTAEIGEPKAPPGGEGLQGRVFMSQASIAELPLSTTTERHDVILRIYRDMLADPTGDIETELALVVSDVLGDLAGDFDLGATIRAIDLGGIYGSTFTATWGYIELGGTMFRIVDIALGLIVDDAATLAA